MNPAHEADPREAGSNDSTMGGNREDITARLLEFASQRPSAPALIVPGRSAMTFGVLAQRIRALTDRFGTWGIGRGDVVVGAAVDRPAYAAALGILPASSTFALLSPSLAVEAYVDLLRRLAPKAVLVPARGEHAIAAAAHRLGLAEIALVPDAGAEAGAFELALTRPALSLDVASRASPQWAHVGATSGTTGRPKLVPNGHRQLVFNSIAVGKRLEMGRDDVSAHLSPLYLNSGQRTGFLLALLNGGAVAILPEAEPEAFFRAIDDGIVTYAAISFAVQREILQRFEAGRRLDGGRLRFVRVASGGMEPDEMDRLEVHYAAPVVTGLGMSECGLLLHQGLPPARRIRGTLGTPVACEVRVVDAGGCELPRGEPGEIQIRGPQVFDGYVDDPELTAAAFCDGWFRTGDLGRMDENQEVSLVGRIKEVINRGGVKIAPPEIDAALRAIPGVADAAAFGVPHPRLGEEVVAAVVRAAGASISEDDVLEQLRARLGARNSPRRIWFVDKLPRNDGGKLLRTALPAWVEFAAGVVSGRAPSPEAETRGSATETALAALWAGVLGRDNLQRDEDFVALGGDASRGAKLLEQVRTVFGVDLSTGALDDQAATIAGMAHCIDRARSPGRS